MNRSKCRLYFSDIHRSLFSLKLLLSCVAIPLLIILDNPTDFFIAVEHPEIFSSAYFYFHSIVFGGLYGKYIVNTLCVIPFALMTRLELNSHFCLYQIRLCGKSTYFQSKFIATMLSGGIVNILGFGLFFIFCGSFMNLCPADSDFKSLSYFRFLYTGHSAFFMTCILLLAFLRGALWSSTALAISMFTNSKSTVLMTPLVGLFIIGQTLSALKVPNEYRFDMWLSARVALFSSEIVSVVASFLFSMMWIYIAWRIFYLMGSEMIEGEAHKSVMQTTLFSRSKRINS